jgi:hypothetical protein
VPTTVFVIIAFIPEYNADAKLVDISNLPLERIGAKSVVNWYAQRF